MRHLVLVAAMAAAGALSTTAGAAALESANAPGMCLAVGGTGATIQRCGGYGQNFDLPDRRGGPLATQDGCVTAARQSRPLYIDRCRRGAPEQIWYYDRSGQLSNAAGLCADVDGGRRRAGTAVNGYQCNGNGNQRWSAVESGQPGPGAEYPPPDGSYPGYPRPGDDRFPNGGNSRVETSLSPRNARSMCLALERNGGTLIIADCDGHSRQRFSYRPGRDTDLQVRGNCVTAPAGSGQSLYVEQCNGSYEQRWTFAGDASIRSASGYCADVDGSRKREGTAVNLYRCSSGADNQQWDASRR